MALSSARESVKHLLRAISSASCRCPAHSQNYGPELGPHILKECRGIVRVNRDHQQPWSQNYSVTSCGHGTQVPQAEEKEYAFEMASSHMRFGMGVTKEVGMDLANLKAKKVCIMTDANIAKLPIMTTVLDSLHKEGVAYELYDTVRVEPTDTSFADAIAFAKKGNFDAYLAVGGGSVIDTCKAANLYATSPESELLDFVNAPLGKGKPVTHTLKPLIAVATTAGSGSESTGVSIFDYEPLKTKTGISNRALKPTLGIVDPLHAMTMPERVAANSGFDVLCHALEAYTTLPYNERIPRPANPNERPAYQGSNPLSDVWCLHTLRIVAEYFKRAVFNPDDLEARSNMHLASAAASNGFGNAGCHLCHAMSYPIAGNVKSFQDYGYPEEHPSVPHGLSVVLTAPAVFSFTYPVCPEKHIEAAGVLGADVRNVRREDAGRVLSDALRKIMYDLKIVNGLTAVGYDNGDVLDLVKGTVPQRRLTWLSPRAQTEEDLAKIFEESMVVY